MSDIGRYKIRQDNLSDRRTDVIDTESEPRRSICQCWFVEDAEKIARLLNDDEIRMDEGARLVALIREKAEARGYAPGYWWKALADELERDLNGGQ